VLSLTMATSEYREAIYGNNLQRLQELIDGETTDNGTVRASRRESALRSACMSGHLDMVRYLVETCQTNVEAADVDGANAVHYACHGGHLAVLKYLVESCGADVEATNRRNGWTTLHTACFRNGNVDMIRYLVETCHVNVLALTDDGSNMVHLACRNGHFDAVRYIVEYGQNNVDGADTATVMRIDINARNHDGDTALILACGTFKAPDMELIQYLVETCLADIAAVNEKGQTTTRRLVL
jgi:ankyrin repeat protein